jgi:hypothetical protein
VSAFPRDPIDVSYERGIQVAHELQGDRASLVRFVAGLVAELSDRNGCTPSEQLRSLHRALLTVTASKFRQAVFDGTNRGVIEGQLGCVLTSAYREHAREQRNAAPEGR